MENSLDFHKRIKSFVDSLPKEVSGHVRQQSRNVGYQDDILPFDLYKNTRQNIERIADQINKAFYYGIYDGCAVLMRRLIEMLLILSFKEHNIDSEIRGKNNNFLNLSDIIYNAMSNRTLDLTNFAKESLDIFREKGNLSAHNLFYNARKKDIELVQSKFRYLFEELLFKSGITK